MDYVYYLDANGLGANPVNLMTHCIKEKSALIVMYNNEKLRLRVEDLAALGLKKVQVIYNKGPIDTERITMQLTSLIGVSVNREGYECQHTIISDNESFDEVVDFLHRMGYKIGRSAVKEYLYTPKLEESSTKTK